MRVLIKFDGDPETAPYDVEEIVLEEPVDVQVEHGVVVIRGKVGS